MTLHAAKGLEFLTWSFCRVGKRACFRTSARSTTTASPGSRRRKAETGRCRPDPVPAGRRGFSTLCNRRVRRAVADVDRHPGSFEESPADHVEFDGFVGSADRADGSRPSARVWTAGFASRYRDARLASGAEVRRQREWGESGSRGPRGSRPRFSKARHIEAERRLLRSFHAGSRVFHNKFGPGAVVAVDGSKSDGRLRQGGAEDR